MINIFLLSIIATLLIAPFGVILKRRKINSAISFQYFSEILIYGLILISFISLLLNFFTPLTSTINTLIFILPLLIIYRNQKFFFNFKFFFFLFLVSFLVSLLLIKSHTYRPDAGLYHLPYISILNNEKIIFGLSNFHFRYGHISIIQYTSAIFNNYIFLTNGIVFPAALFYASIILNFISQIKIYLENKNYNFHLFFLISVTTYIFGKMGRYAEFGNDAPAHLLFFFLLSEILRNNLNHKLSEIRNFFLIAIFIFMNKIFLILSIIFPLIFISKNNCKKLFFNGKNLLTSIFFLMWIIKSIIVSGCVIYPIKPTCINNLSWTDINTVEIVSAEGEAWAKVWPDYIKFKGKISHLDYNKDFKWLKTWIDFNSDRSFKILLIYSLVLIFIGLLFYKKNNNLNSLKKIHFKKIKLIILILLIGISIWFLKSPNYRFGTGYIIGLMSILFSIIISRHSKKNLNKKIFTILIISFVIFFSKNVKRIVTVEKNYFNTPWPKYFSHSEDNIYKKPKKIMINKKKLYITNGLCFYGLAPCSRHMVKFKVVRRFNYDFFIIK